MEKKRIIFDLDGTIMTSGDYRLQEDYFRKLYGYSEKANNFVQNIGFYLTQYECMFKTYTVNDLAKFLTLSTGLNITENDIRGWIDLPWSETDYLEPGIVEVLEYLKSKDVSLVVLTNWFLQGQKDRLASKGLLQYFDEVVGGELCLKPHLEAYDWARGKFSRKDCLFVGDDFYKDYLGAVFAGYDAVLYDKDDKQDGDIVKIKRMNELIKKL